MRNEKKGKKGIKRVQSALLYSLEGIRSAWQDEEAFRQIFILAIFGFGGSFFLARSWMEWAILILPCFLAVMSELVNSAIENAVDFTGIEFNPFAKKAKDMGSAVQFFACIFWVLIWGGYVLERFLL